MVVLFHAYECLCARARPPWPPNKPLSMRARAYVCVWFFCSKVCILLEIWILMANHSIVHCVDRCTLGWWVSAFTRVRHFGRLRALKVIYRFLSLFFGNIFIFFFDFMLYIPHVNANDIVMLVKLSEKKGSNTSTYLWSQPFNQFLVWNE